jgi:N-glycosylase/DNA lyase
MTLHQQTLETSTSAMNIHATIFSGQLFRFHADNQGVISGTQVRNVIELTQTESSITIRTSHANPGSYLKDFFALDAVNLERLAASWDNIPLFHDAWHQQPGIRITKQDPHECIFAFLCASAAPISRISQMLNTLAKHHGTHIGENLYTFPTLEQLQNLTEGELRSYGFGFRAPRIIAAARYFFENDISMDALASLS